MAHVAENYPLYYDAVNEAGLGMAGLNFVGNAFYGKAALKLDVDQIKHRSRSLNLSHGYCHCVKNVQEAKEKIKHVKLVDTPFNSQFPLAQLHWIIADKTGAITVESMQEGLHVYDNPVGVLTNNPPFEFQMAALSNYRALSPKQPENTFGQGIELTAYSRGMER